MQQEHNNNHLKDIDDEIDLLELLSIILKEKRMIISITAFISILGVIYSLLLPNIYQSKALLVPVNVADSITGSMGAYGGLAGLAGINLPSALNDVGNSVKAIHKINSLSFFEKNILTNIYLPDLMAAKSWSSRTNTLIYDDNIYDIDSNTWVRDISYPKQKIPSAQESFKAFKSKHLSLSEDKKTGFITLSIKHKSPYIAKEWVELIVNEVNSFYRKKDKAESEKAVNYLNKQISMTTLSEIKQVVAQLLQEETKKLTLIEANQSYVFDYIDPPAVMERKSEPSRAKICILISLFGGMLSIALVLLKHYVFKKKDIQST